MNLQDIRYALKSTDEEIRRSAVNSLRNIQHHDAQTIIFTAMGDESWRVRKEAVECYVCSKPDLSSVGLLLGLLRNGENAGLRNSAAEAVIRLGSLSAEPLLKMVQDHDSDVRKFVIDAMGAIRDPIFVPALLQALNDPEVNVASAAAEQLGAIGDPEAAEYLIRAILARDEELFRFSALRSLGLLAKPVQVPEELVKLADQDILRKTVYECLGAISDESSFDLLLNGLSCRQKNCRSAAFKAIYKIYERSSIASQTKIREALQKLKENEVIKGLVELFDNRDVVLTEGLLWLSDIVRDVRFIPLLIEAYSDERTSRAALKVLKNYDHEALQEIVSIYPSLDEAGRSGLCILIAECGYCGFNDVIHEALRDHSAQVRKAAAFAVGKLGLTQSIPDLVSLIDDSEMQVYSAVVSSLQSLIKIRRSSILDEVIMFCSSKVPHHRKAAAHLMAALGERDRLLLLIKDEDPQVRKAAVSAAGDYYDEASASLLVLALTDEDPDVRIAVADALGRLRNSETLDALEHALNDQDFWVQSAVLKAIAKIEAARALSIIKNIHTTTEGLLMITCLKILEEIGGPEAEEIFRYALQNSNHDIARQAAMSLERVIVAKSI
ncbi:MAG: HEAT repeat domain-containing protein [Geobacteraceae bacterium]|nr:HEAT repeat domain-containing protein [Geobacteraceae bacterium]NTW80468.1 HEAT repeat domain-containing protein [Geobacteraceae bacterium]